MAKVTIKGLEKEISELKKRLEERRNISEQQAIQVQELSRENGSLKARIDDGIKLFKEQEVMLDSIAAMRSIIERSTRTLAKLACGHEQYDNAAKMRQTAAETLEQIVRAQNGIETRMAGSGGGPRRFFGMDFAK